MLQVSTGYKSLILGPNAFEDIFAFGVIRFFQGSQPATADDAEVGTKVGEVTLGGLPFRQGFEENGLTFTRNGPEIGKLLTDYWAILSNVTGAPGWFRIVGNAPDAGDASFSLPRIDGDIGVVGSGAIMQLETLDFNAGSTYPLDYFFYTIPPVAGL